MRNGEFAVRAPAFCVHAPLRDHFAVKVRHLFHQPYVLHHHRSARAGGNGIFIVRYRGAYFICQFPFVLFTHIFFSFSESN